MNNKILYFLVGSMYLSLPAVGNPIDLFLGGSEASGDVVGYVSIKTPAPGSTPRKLDEMRLSAGVSVVAPCSDLTQFLDYHFDNNFQAYATTQTTPVTNDELQNFFKTTHVTCMQVDMYRQGMDYSSGPVQIIGQEAQYAYVYKAFNPFTVNLVIAH